MRTLTDQGCYGSACRQRLDHRQEHRMEHEQIARVIGFSSAEARMSWKVA